MNTAIFLLLCAFSLISLGEIQAALTPETPATEAGQFLQSSETHQKFDGGNLHLVTFQFGTRALRYTPPTGWTLQTGSERTLLSRGGVTASLALIALSSDAPAAAEIPSAEEMERFHQESETLAPAAGRKAEEPTVLPVKVANETVTENTVHYQLNGQPYILQRIKSWGTRWRTELVVTGPEKQFTEAQPSLVQSLCSIDVQTEKERTAKADVKEEVVLDKIIRNETSPKTIPVGKVRGRLP